MTLEQLKGLSAYLDRLRVLQVAFRGARNENRTHNLLTTTPQSIPLPDERHALTGYEIRNLIDCMKDVCVELQLRMEEEHETSKKEDCQ